MPSVKFLLCALGAFLVFGAVAFAMHAAAAWSFARGVARHRKREAMAGSLELEDPRRQRGGVSKSDALQGSAPIYMVRSKILPESKPFFNRREKL